MRKNTDLKICIRLPNWLGDVVMSFGFLYVLRNTFPGAHISAIVKKELVPILQDSPYIDEVFAFSKQEHKGLRGAWRYGKHLRARQFDLFFVLPDSLSSAAMAYASRSKERIGYRKEGRQWLLTQSFVKEKGLHRVEEYAGLVYRYTALAQAFRPVLSLPSDGMKRGRYMVVNINSEAVSRRLPKEKAAELISLLQQYGLPIKLIGSLTEKDYVTNVYRLLPSRENTEVLAGQTTLPQLKELIQQASLMVTSDSGPAHIAAAAQTPLVVLCGAGDEKNTGPYQNPRSAVVRNGQLPCEPCVKNKCKLGPLPVCMLQLAPQKVLAAVNHLLEQND